MNLPPFKNFEVTLGKCSCVPNKQGHGSLEIDGGQYCSMLCEDYLHVFVTFHLYIYIIGFLPYYCNCNRTNSSYIVSVKSYTNFSYVKLVIN